MKSVRKLLGVFAFGFVTALAWPIIARANETTDALIKKIAPDGINAVFKVKTPTSIEEGDFLINGYVNNLLQGDDYEVTAGCYEAPYTSCTVTFRSNDYQTTWENGQEIVIAGWKETYTLNATYDEPKSNLVVDSYFSKLNNADMLDPTTFYYVEDLALINYYLTSDKSELWNPGAPGRALKYSSLNNVTNGSNVTYNLDVRAGNQDETLMFESAFGSMNLFYNGYLYGTKEEGIYLKRVIYIPEDTEETKEAYIAAAQKRINNYLGNTNVVVSYGGLLTSLPADAQDIDYPITSDGNYYNIKIGNRTYKFYIIKGNTTKLVEPEYVGLDLNSKIEITSKDASIPLDTSLIINTTTDSSIENIIGTQNYKSYDITLYSAAKNAKIEKLENNKFLVKIPVPEELNGKDLIVYYITSEGTKEPHEVTILNGYATFETNHFSTYVLAEKVLESTPEPEEPTIDNPTTSDSISKYFIIATISLTILATTIYIKKRNNE